MGPAWYLLLFWPVGFSSSTFAKDDDFCPEKELSRFVKKYYQELRAVVIIDHGQMWMIHATFHPLVPVVTFESPGMMMGDAVSSVDCFLIYFGDLSTLESDIVALKSTRSWNSRARYVLLARNVTFNAMKAARDFLWKNQIGRAIFVHQNSTEARFTKCNPFKEILEPVDDRISRNESVFEDFKNLHGYPIREDHYETLADKSRPSDIYEHIEKHYLMAVLATMNATEINGLGGYDLDDYNDKSSGKPVGIEGNFANHLTDVAFVGWTLVYKDNSYVELMYPHEASESDLVMIVLKAGLMSQGDKMTLQYEMTVWILIPATVFASAIAWYIIRDKSSSSKPFWDSFGLLFSFSLGPPSASREKLIFAGMTFVGIVLTNAFVGRLTALYTADIIYKDIDTIEELCQSDLRVHIGELLFKNLILNNAEGIPPCLFNRIEPISFKEIKLHLNGHHADRAVIMPYQHALRVVSEERQHDENGQSLLYIMKEVVVPNFECFAVVRGLPYLERMNAIMLRIREVRLSIHWHTMYSLFTGQKLHHPTVFPRKVLTVDDLKSTFFLLFGGLTLSGFAFIGELIWTRRSKILPKIFGKLFKKVSNR